MKIDFLPAAEKEFADAADHYNLQHAGLGFDFASEEKLDQRHRRVPLRRFPYTRIYRVDAQSIRIVAVAHRRRRPRYRRPLVQDR